MEKQQFQALNLAFAQMLAQLNYEEKPPLPDLSDFSGDIQHDFRVGRLGLGTIAATIHPYPTQADAIRKVADAWNRTRLTPRVKRLFETWLAWTR